MKAALRNEYGGPEVIRIGEIPIPEPGSHEVLIRVHTTTVNRTDCANLTAKPDIMRLTMGLRKPRNPVLGTDFAGVVEATGSEVSAFQPGDRVFGFDDSGIRSQAEYMTFPENKGIGIIPARTGFAEAAASIEGFHYALNFLNKVKLRQGDKVMINGATGAIGSACLQLVHHHGGIVTATCRQEDTDQVMALGAQRVIDYVSEDFTQDHEKYEFVFDTVGKSTFGRCRHLLKPGGTYISSELGPGAQNPFLALVTPLTGGRRVKFPIPFNISESIRLASELLNNGTYRPLTDRSFSLEEAAAAYQYVMSGQKKGNVVLQINK